eukprot:3418342-Amphidinium_carterae.1
MHRPPGARLCNTFATIWCHTPPVPSCSILGLAMCIRNLRSLQSCYHSKSCGELCILTSLQQ